MRAEIPHNSPEQVRDYISAALALVEDLDVPEDLRVAVFTHAVTHFAAKQIFQSQPEAPQIGVPRMDIPRGRINGR